MLKNNTFRCLLKYLAMLSCPDTTVLVLFIDCIGEEGKIGHVLLSIHFFSLCFEPTEVNFCSRHDHSLAETEIQDHRSRVRTSKNGNAVSLSSVLDRRQFV